MMENKNEAFSRALVQDYRDGALGRISLETPQTRGIMLAQAPKKNEAAAHAEADDSSLE